MPAGFAATSVAARMEWPLKLRVKLNSPSLCPTMFSVTYTGMNLLPLCTANVCPTKSGITVLERDHVFTTRLSLRPAFIAPAFLIKLSWTYGPLCTLLAIIESPCRACGHERSGAETPSSCVGSSHLLSCPTGSRRSGHHACGRRAGDPRGS